MTGLWLLFSCALLRARVKASPNRAVAMCITGQLARLRPESLLRHVVRPNLPAFRFEVIYAMGASRALIEHKMVAGVGTRASTRFVNASSAAALREALDRVRTPVWRWVASWKRLQRGSCARPAYVRSAPHGRSVLWPRRQ